MPKVWEGFPPGGSSVMRRSRLRLKRFLRKAEYHRYGIPQRSRRQKKLRILLLVWKINMEDGSLSWLEIVKGIMSITKNALSVLCVRTHRAHRT